MSEVDLKLEWKDEGGQARRDDRFERDLPQTEGEVTATEPEPDEFEEDEDDEFEYSEIRARAIERALGRLQGVHRPPFVTYLRTLLADYPRLDPAERQARLNGAEAWLSSQLADWSPGPVVAEDESDEEVVEVFQQAVNSGADALGLGLEVVALISRGECGLAVRLLEQVEASLTQAPQALESL
ncbi:MAG: hypothetical protein KC910_21880 [Candidatus Eremiobacteraeota bacterium]|nr:hypothetical protein [Candidatus Eremiobacteraeota bacterium]